MNTNAHTLWLGTNPRRLQEVRTSQVIGRSTATHPSTSDTIYKALIVTRVRRPLFRLAPWLITLIPNERMRHHDLLIRDVIVTRDQYFGVLSNIETYVE